MPTSTSPLVKLHCCKFVGDISFVILLISVVFVEASRKLIGVKLVKSIVALGGIGRGRISSELFGGISFVIFAKSLELCIVFAVSWKK